MNSLANGSGWQRTAMISFNLVSSMANSPVPGKVIFSKPSDGAIFQFDARNTLETSALAQFVGKPARYPDAMDWHAWLGPKYEVISADLRETILSMPPDDAQTTTVITNMREPDTLPVVQTSKHRHPVVDFPPELTLVLPRGAA